MAVGLIKKQIIHSSSKKDSPTRFLRVEEIDVN